MTRSRLTRVGVGVAGALAASAALAMPARATSLVVPTDCPAAELTQPFAQWGDESNYKLIEGRVLRGRVRGVAAHRRRDAA